MSASSVFTRLKHHGIGFIKAVWKEYLHDNTAIVAAGVAYYLLLSIIPLLLFLVSVAAYFISPAQITDLQEQVIRIFGTSVGGVLRSEILTVVQNRGLLTGLSIAFGLWAGSTVFVILQETMNRIWRIKQRRSFFAQRGIALLMVILTGVLVLLAIALSYLGNLLNWLDIRINEQSASTLLWLLHILMSAIIPAILVTLAFSMIYRYLPSRKVAWRVVVPGAITAAILWVGALYLFNWYTLTIANYNLLYGSLGSIIVLMLWLLVSAHIMLIGAAVSFTITHTGGEGSESARNQQV